MSRRKTNLLSKIQLQQVAELVDFVKSDPGGVEALLIASGEKPDQNKGLQIIQLLQAKAIKGAAFDKDLNVLLSNQPKMNFWGAVAGAISGLVSSIGGDGIADNIADVATDAMSGGTSGGYTGPSAMSQILAQVEEDKANAATTGAPDPYPELSNQDIKDLGDNPGSGATKPPKKYEGMNDGETLEDYKTRLTDSRKMWRTGAIVAAGAFAVAVGWIIWGK